MVTELVQETVAKWLSRDPLPDAERLLGPNLYEYCLNNPIDGEDPEGLLGFTVSLGLSGSAGAFLGGTGSPITINVGLSTTSGLTGSITQSVGLGVYLGAGGSASGVLTFTNANNVSDLNGMGWELGGSAREGPSVGAGLVGSGCTSPISTYGGFYLSLGGGGGVPLEGHAFVTETFPFLNPNYQNPVSPYYTPGAQ
jgi:hypothetical protein